MVDGTTSDSRVGKLKTDSRRHCKYIICVTSSRRHDTLTQAYPMLAQVDDVRVIPAQNQLKMPEQFHQVFQMVRENEQAAVLAERRFLSMFSDITPARWNW